MIGNLKMIIKITSDKNYKVLNDKKEWIRTFSKFDTYIAETQDGNKDGVLKYFKKWINVKRMPKCFKVEVLELPNNNKIHEIRGNEHMVYLVLNGKIVYEWSDSANTDYPEDLDWSRMISDVFYSGFDLGQKISQGLV
jgi:hypothetical protein